MKLGGDLPADGTRARRAQMTHPSARLRITAIVIAACGSLPG